MFCLHLLIESSRQWLESSGSNYSHGETDGAWFEATWACLGVGNVNLHVLHPAPFFFFFFSLLFLASGTLMLKGAGFWARDITPCLPDKLMASLLFQCSDSSCNDDVLPRNLGQLSIWYLFKCISLNMLYLHGNTLHPSECASNCSSRDGCMSIVRMDWLSLSLWSCCKTNPMIQWWRWLLIYVQT